MPRTRRWMLAVLVMTCVMIAPISAPTSSVADRSTAPTQESPISIASVEDEDESEDSLWHGIRFPDDASLSAGFFSRLRSADMLPNPDEYVARDGVGEQLTGRGGGETLDFYPLSLDGTRVFPLAEGTFRISQEFGCVPLDPGYALADFCPPDRPSFHNGVDLAANPGVTIYAAATGTVNFSDIDSSSRSGNSVIRIVHDGPNSGYVTDYLHWKASYVESGDYVIAGQPIAEVGSVGYSTGPHLHFGVFDARASEYIEPLTWLKGSESMPVAIADGGTGGVDGVMQWSTLIEVASVRHGIPAALIAAIITVESGGNPEAVSPAGAQGLMQVMPMHLERYGIPKDKWRDPATNIDAGSRLLAELLAANGTLTNTVGAYFGHGCDVLGTCTSEYIAAVFSWYNYYVPIFSGVAVDASAFEFDLPEPGSSEFPSAEDQPTPTPAPTPAPSPSPEPTETPERTATPGPEETATPRPTETPPANDDEGEPAADDSTDDGARDEADPEPTPSPTPVPQEPVDDDEAVDDGHDQATDEDEVVEGDDSEAVDEDEGNDQATDDDEAAEGDDRDAVDEDEGNEEATDEDEADDEHDSIMVEGHGSHWILDTEANAILRVNPEDDHMIAMIEVGGEPYDIAISDGAVWISVPEVNQVLRIDPETNEVDLEIEMEHGPRGLLVTEEGLWIATYNDHRIVLLDLEETNIVEEIEVGIAPCYVVLDEGVILVSSCETGEFVAVERE
jgi:murein DD-endopeptidase MepM/ murein hydrolase activator NlpD